MTSGYMVAACAACAAAVALAVLLLLLCVEHALHQTQLLVEQVDLLLYAGGVFPPDSGPLQLQFLERNLPLDFGLVALVARAGDLVFSAVQLDQAQLQIGHAARSAAVGVVQLLLARIDVIQRTRVFVGQAAQQ